MNGSKSVGPFSIAIKLLKLLKKLLSSPLEYLYNYSFSIGKVPCKFKNARVILVYKKGNKTSMANYRPISPLSVFNKIMEKLMYNRLTEFFQKNDVFFTGQFGFRSSHSTTHAI